MSTDPTGSSAQSVTDTGGSWNSNAVWKSFETEEWERFERFQREAYRLNSRVQGSAFIPSTFRDYLNRRLTILEDDIRMLKLKIEAKEQQSNAETEPSRMRMTGAFGGKNMEAITQFFAATILRTTIHDVVENENLNSDVDFVAQAEFLVGKVLLKEL